MFGRSEVERAQQSETNAMPVRVIMETASDGQCSVANYLEIPELV